MTKVERIVLGVLLGMLTLSLLMLLRLFYIQNTMNVAIQGGTYIEGSVGEVKPLNPWFVTSNDVNRDIISLVFAGLMKYDPLTGKVIDDLAHVDVSADNRTFTATLNAGLEWQDSTKQQPHLVTADDVVFTFKTMQDPQFTNPILKQNFRGVEIEKIDEHVVRFRLNKPYSFFTSNLTMGILPKSAFDGVPVRKLDQTLDFGFHPIGAGPYSFVSLLQTDLSTEVTLKRFDRPRMPQYNIDRIVLRVFPEYSALLTDITNLNGVRLVPRNEEGLPILPRHFHPLPYTLPQYVGLFFNLDHPIPADHGVRLGLQLAVNKQAVADAIHETQVIDTPLLEFDTGDWHYKFDSAAAKGAFFASSWNIPEKVRLQHLLEQRSTNKIGPLSAVPRIALLGTGATLTITGSTKNLKFPVFVNGTRVQTGSKLPDGTMKALSGSWIVRLSSGGGMSGTLKVGVNILKMADAKDDIVDTAFLERITDSKSFERASVEEGLIEQFIAAKQLPDSDPKHLYVNDMYLENGYLRRITANDAPHTRINDAGKKLSLTLLTSPTPTNYPIIADIIRKEWAEVGVDVKLDVPESKKDFEDKLLQRKYDVVLFGQALFDNLDSYPYWHSSQIQEKTDDPQKLKLDAFNLSQYASFDADALLAKIRETSDAKSRSTALGALNEQLKKDSPAIVLYSPLYVYAYDESVHGIELGKLALHADRFVNTNRWYVSTKRQFLPQKGWFSFFGWFLTLVK